MGMGLEGELGGLPCPFHHLGKSGRSERCPVLRSEYKGASCQAANNHKKNALFAGSHGGGRTWATIATLLQTAKMNDVEPTVPFGDQRLTHLARILYTPAGALYTNGFAWARLGGSDGEIGVSGSAMTLAAASHLAWSGKSSVLMLELTPAPRPAEVPMFCGVAINTTRTKVHMVNLLLKSPRSAGKRIHAAT